jgi:hypothetical protein
MRGSGITLRTNQTFEWFVAANPTATFAWNINNLTLTSPGDQTNTERNNESPQLWATDSGNLPLTSQASGLPSGLSLNSSTGLISGIVATGDAANGPNTGIAAPGEITERSANPPPVEIK